MPIFHFSYITGVCAEGETEAEARENAVDYVRDEPDSYRPWTGEGLRLVNIDEADECQVCMAFLVPNSAFPWHLPDEDCRAVRKPVQEEL